MPLPMAEVIFKDPFQSKHFCDSMILYKPVQESHWTELESPHEPKADLIFVCVELLSYAAEIHLQLDGSQ